MDNNKEEYTIFKNYQKQIDVWYKSHNIVREKTELYYDFLCSLLNIINETYLGDDIAILEEDKINHFNWCYNKVIFNFENEKIYFLSKGELQKYLWNFFYDAYYTSDVKDKKDMILSLFKLLFNYNRVKTPKEMESFIELYKIFNQDLKKII